MIKLSPVFKFTEPLVTSGSGLVLKDDHFTIISDDELSAVVVEKTNPILVKKIELFPGILSDDHKLRKETKPDLESIVQLPSGDLLCIPSGSEIHRNQGVLIKDNGAKVEIVKFKALYAQLRKSFSELNIEGAVVVGEWLRLFQRGNGRKNQNGTIDVNLADLLVEKITISFVKHMELGKHNGENLSFTDATLFNDKIYFLAVSEACESTYLDGEFKGSGLGIIDLKGKIIGIEPLDLKHKPEGLCIDKDTFYVVTDDDDRTKPSQLFKGSLPKSP